MNPENIEYKETGWIDLALDSTGRFTANGALTLYFNYTEALWGRAGYRVSKDGLVTMRGLVRRIGGVSVVAGEPILQIPPAVCPTYRRRFNGQTAQLEIYGNLAPAVDIGVLKVDQVYYPSDFLVLDGIQFYIGS